MRIEHSRLHVLAALGATAALSVTAFADLVEGFDDIATLVPGGWYMQNNSSPAGTTDWFQGNPDVWAAHTGAPDSYIAANYNNCSGLGTISNWLLTPAMTLQDGDTLTFYARASDSTWPDRLQVRMSTAGDSTDVGTGPFDVGDFSTLLLDINPDYQQGVFVNAWTEYVVELSGLGTPTDGRLAFRYFVEDAGPSGINSDFIGIDTLSYAAVPAPGALALLALAGLARSRRR